MDHPAGSLSDQISLVAFCVTDEGVTNDNLPNIVEYLESIVDFRYNR